MKVLIAGIDGYLGWSLACHLVKRGHAVSGIDNQSRREWVKDVGSVSAIPIETRSVRCEAIGSMPEAFQDESGQVNPKWYSSGDKIMSEPGDMLDYKNLQAVVWEAKPDAVVHLAEQPSAPFSMRSAAHAGMTQHNNVVGSLNLLWAIKEAAPKSHLIKLGCYDDQTEILTRNGWKLFADLTGEEEVAVRDADNRALRYQRPKSIHTFDYAGKMYQVHNNRLDLLVTPNHRMFTVQRSDGKYGPLRLETTEDIKGKCRVYDIGLEWDGTEPEAVEVLGKQVPAELWMQFLGWYIAEGHAEVRQDRPNSTRLTIKQKHGPKADALREVLAPIAEALATSLTETEEAGAFTCFHINGVPLAKHMAMLGQSADKYIPAEYKAMGRVLLGELLDTLIAGDGWEHHRGFRYHTISRQLADDVQEIALKCGWAATITGRNGGYQVNLSPSIYAHVGHAPDKPNDSWVDYDGKVYCVAVGGDGIVLVRRNGKVCWCGNTMGEYGTPECPIPEGVFPDGSWWLTKRGAPNEEIWNISGMLFPRAAGSWYHQSKVHDTHNTIFACKTWGLRSTDIMQGVVYGTWIDAFGDDPRLRTRFDFDECFGTAINRFCAQAVIGHPLTVYGEGWQKRGFLPLRDAMQCLTIAIENAPEPGEYRTWNQFEEVYAIRGLAERVGMAAVRAGLNPVIKHLKNPRREAADHFYEPEHKHLADLGYQPTHDMDAELDRMLADLTPHADRIKAHEAQIMPMTHWSGEHEQPEELAADYQI